MNKDRLELILKNALLKLKENDQYLLTLCSERAVVHRLSIYIDNELNPTERTIDTSSCANCSRLPNTLSNYEKSNLIIDCEYNRNANTIKRSDGNTLYPDIIIHKRGCKCKNLVSIEAKNIYYLSSGRYLENFEAIQSDITELARYQVETLNYEYRVFIGLPRDVLPNDCFIDNQSIAAEFEVTQSRTKFETLKYISQQSSNKKFIVLIFSSEEIAYE